MKELKPIVRNIGKSRNLGNGLIQSIAGGTPIVDKRNCPIYKNGKYLFKDAISIIFKHLPAFDEPLKQ